MDNDRTINMAKECLEARRAMRMLLLKMDDPQLRDAYYKALMLSEHEAARRILNDI